MNFIAPNALLDDVEKSLDRLLEDLYRTRNYRPFMPPADLSQQERISAKQTYLDQLRRQIREQESLDDLRAIKQRLTREGVLPDPNRTAEQGFRPQGNAFPQRIVSLQESIPGIPSSRDLAGFGSSRALDTNSLAARLGRIEEDAGRRAEMDFRRMVPYAAPFALNDPRYLANAAQFAQLDLLHKQAMADYVAKERDRAVKAFMEMSGIPLAAYQAQTGRQAAALQEYAQREGMADKTLGEMALEQMRQQGELRKAAINARAMGKQAQTLAMKDAIDALRLAGQDTEENVQRVINRFHLMRDAFTPEVDTTSAGIDYVDAFLQRHLPGLQQRELTPEQQLQQRGVADLGDAAQFLEKLALQDQRVPQDEMAQAKLRLEKNLGAAARELSSAGRGIDTVAFLNQALPGRQVDERGKVVKKGVFDPEVIANAIIDFGDAVSDEDIKLLVDRLSKEGYGDPKEIINKIARYYLRLSSRANVPEGAGGWKAQVDEKDNRSYLIKEGVGKIYVGAPGSLNNYYAGTSDLFPTFRQSTADQARSSAEALERFMDQWISHRRGK